MSEARPAARFSFARQVRLTTKEFRETLRDRRTIVTLILMPLLVYPLLSISFQKLLFSGLSGTQETVYFIAFENPQAADAFRFRMSEADRALKDMGERTEPIHVDWQLTDALEAVVADGSASLGVRVHSFAPPQPGVWFQLFYRADNTGLQALNEIETRLRALNEFALEAKISQLGGDPVPPAGIRRVRLEPTSGVSPLATLVPLILILMTITGAVYPAIDLTAGERERGTLETLIAAPASRLSILLAKYAAVVIVAILTATVNLAAMTMTIYFSGLGPLLFGAQGLSILVIARVFALLVLFAAFFAAVLLSITSVARSFKEAQAYLIPLMLVSIAPGLLSIMPGVELSNGLATVPLVNMVLLARDIFHGGGMSMAAFVAIATTLLYSVVAIGFAARVFGGDAILYGSSRSWSDLLRRPNAHVAQASTGNALFWTAFLFPAQFVLGGLIARSESWPLTQRMIAAGTATVLLFGGVPLMATAAERVRYGSGLRLRFPNPLLVPPIIILGFALWPLAHEVYLLGVAIGLAQVSEQQLVLAREILTQWKQMPEWLLILAIGVLPGICEELFFRGLLFSALRSKLAPFATVAVTAIIFGVFHLVTPNTLATERLLPSTFLGLILGWISLRTGSVLPGMVVHSLHNSFVIHMAFHYNIGNTWGSNTAHVPTTWLAAGAIASVVSLAAVYGLTSVAPPERRTRPFGEAEGR